MQTPVALRFDLWIYGLVSAAVGGGAGAVTSAVSAGLIAPDKFNLSGQLHNTVHLMLAAFAINALFGFFSYLSKHPAPEWEGGERRLQEVTDDANNRVKDQ